MSIMCYIYIYIYNINKRMRYKKCNWKNYYIIYLYIGYFIIYMCERERNLKKNYNIYNLFFSLFFI